MSQIIIRLGDDDQTLDLKFEVLDTAIGQRWLDQVRMFVALGSPFDDRERFYNFPNSKFTRDYCENHVRKLVDIIAPYIPDLATVDLAVFDQDTLNRLHHVFELYHGLYDAQKTNLAFQSLSPQAKSAIADLNIWIHRLETFGQDPRFVVTWHTKPCRMPLYPTDLDLMTLEENWGDLRLNYCDIGKTLECLWQDNDQYISEQAFRPMRHFSMDFVVKFSNHGKPYYQTRARQIWQYFDQKQQFFQDLGFQRSDIQLGSITVAKLLHTGSKQSLISDISEYARVHSIMVKD